jgi:hypothetical protein
MCRGKSTDSIRSQIHSQALTVVFISRIGALMLSRLYNGRQPITFALRHIEQYIEYSFKNLTP